MLPQKPGHFFWFIFDLHYFDVGAVRVMLDSPTHRKMLENAPTFHGQKNFFIYENEAGETLTMYYLAASHNDLRHVPPQTDGCPIVDGFVEFDFHQFLGKELK